MNDSKLDTTTCQFTVTSRSSSAVHCMGALKYGDNVPSLIPIARPCPLDVGEAGVLFILCLRVCIVWVWCIGSGFSSLPLRLTELVCCTLFSCMSDSLL